MSTGVRKLAHHVEVRKHLWVVPLLVESKRSAGKTRDEDDGGLVGVASGLRPDQGAIPRGNVDREGGSSKRERGEEGSKLHSDAWAVIPQKGLCVRKTGIAWSQMHPTLASKYSPGIRTVVGRNPIAQPDRKYPCCHTEAEGSRLITRSRDRSTTCRKQKSSCASPSCLGTDYCLLAIGCGVQPATPVSKTALRLGVASVLFNPGVFLPLSGFLMAVLLPTPFLSGIF